MRDIKYIHFWKKLISDEELQLWLDKFKLYHQQAWLILLREKLDRAEI